LTKFQFEEHHILFVVKVDMSQNKKNINALIDPVKRTKKSNHLFSFFA